MKLKFLPLIAIFSLALVFSCQKNPQKRAEEKAKQEAQKAESRAEKAESHMDKSVENAAKALDHATMQELNAAIANVEVPKFDNLAASELVKKFGNHALDYVNSKTNEQAGKFVDAMNGDIASLAKKVTDGSISQEDATTIKNYAVNLAKALGVELE